MKQVHVYLLVLPFLFPLGKYNAPKEGITFKFYKFNKLGSIDSVHYYQNPIFILENNTDTTFIFTSHAIWKDHDGGPLYFPIYGSFDQKSRGKWKNVFMGWCGNGLSTDTLSPGEKIFMGFEFGNSAHDIKIDSISYSTSLHVPGSNYWRYVSTEAIKFSPVSEN